MMNVVVHSIREFYKFPGWEIKFHKLKNFTLKNILWGCLCYHIVHIHMLIHHLRCNDGDRPIMVICRLISTIDLPIHILIKIIHTNACNTILKLYFIVCTNYNMPECKYNYF